MTNAPPRKGATRGSTLTFPYPPRIVQFCSRCRVARNEGETACRHCGEIAIYERDVHAVRLDSLDFSTGHAINQNAQLVHDERCSSAQTNAAFLCDCGAVEREWERLRAEEPPTQTPERSEAKDPDSDPLFIHRVDPEGEG